MIPAILGRKIGMTQIFGEDGSRVPVTVVQAGPCVVLQVKSADSRDGYHAVQLGLDDVKPHRSTLAQIGHARPAQTAPKRFIREIRLKEATDRKVGDTVTVELFDGGKVKFVDVTGVTKGKGFQGAMKRWGFGGQPASHGTERKHRSPGSQSGHAANRGTGGKPKRGKRMAGRMGGERRTARCQALVGVDVEKGVLLIRGATPGAKGSFLIVRKAKTKA